MDDRKVEFLDVTLIETWGARRAIQNEAVDKLAESISQIGLRTPISVRYYEDRPADAPPGQTDDAIVLMTGAHRLAAIKKLGWDKVECFVHYAGDEIDAELWEIAENLHRAELTALERDEQVARWVELTEARLQSRQPDANESKRSDGRGHRAEGGVRAAARDLGLSEPDARRAKKIGSISDEAKAAAQSHGLDNNRTALHEIARAPKEDQARVVHEIAERKRTGVDADVKRRAAQEVASLMAEHIPGECWDALKANLYAAGASIIANELTNMTGQSVMDNSRIAPFSRSQRAS